LGQITVYKSLKLGSFIAILERKTHMGELIPILVGILFILAIAAAVYLRKGLSLRQVVKNVDDMDMVERIKIPLTPMRAGTLANKLNQAVKEMAATKKPVIIDHPDTDDRIIRFVVAPEKK
jgi:hypothetical protein